MTDPRGQQPPSGSRRWERRPPFVRLATALVLLFVLLGTTAVLVGAAVGSATASSVAPEVAVATEETIASRSLPSPLPAAGRLRTCSVASVLADSRLVNFSGYVAHAVSGEILFDRNGSAPERTGSVMKVLTAAAALSVLGPDAQFTTRVLDGPVPGAITLKGGGDPTLATTPGTVYRGAPLIADLAAATVQQYQRMHPGVPLTQIVLDSTLWDPNDRWDDSWLRKDQTDGYQAEVSALMVDGGRADASSIVSTRTSDPIGATGYAFASAAGLDGVAISAGSAVGSTVLAEVRSQPLSVLIQQMLEWSDNALAESIARVTSVEMGSAGSAASLAQVIPEALSRYGVDTAALGIRDGSGLSDLNRVPPAFVVSLFTKIYAGEQNLSVIYNSLPVAGQTGTLASRFTGENAAAAGQVIAKTGWIDSVYALAGTINAADGTPLAFMFTSIREGITADTKEAHDTLATAIFSCGDNLSNN